ncbi:hypothetical protein CYMTET_40857 [Cymbomonas tetramitiformis]|uniref:Uncharacterized protein n=1 Tax=Cymbomonas tetramitiformis TaxID=36881 RepID=A0AAE0F347_9CHLO|nr:hypothetical protein CYMTET_40857 [Cymbomonas tetramitiformis]
MRVNCASPWHFMRHNCTSPWHSMRPYRTSPRHLMRVNRASPWHSMRHNPSRSPALFLSCISHPPSKSQRLAWVPVVRSAPAGATLLEALPSSSFAPLIPNVVPVVVAGPYYGGNRGDTGSVNVCTMEEPGHVSCALCRQRRAGHGRQARLSDVRVRVRAPHPDLRGEATIGPSGAVAALEAQPQVQ